ncbi:hypothetical protein [Nocardia sp. NPDC057668]|uniref:hypothetical protein n=1 Tax=Nocardia sp. NPDC057668 TaxID=3346202 RepID=UPI00366F71E9
MKTLAKAAVAAVLVSAAIGSATATAAPLTLDPAPATAQEVAVTPIATTGSALTDAIVAPVLFPLAFLAFGLCARAADPASCPAMQLYNAAASGSGVRN